MLKSNMDCQIDVVLTAYKRPEVLQKQIDAIKKQSIKINNIYLYQDGINSYYSIKFSDDFLAQFSGTCINDKNVGVWGRFEYAYNVCSAKYVCIFDDDTIPGDKWIENCYKCSLKYPGIYGTNGVIVDTADSYPLKMTNVGWHSPNSEIIQVDFVGHSWFLQTEWLKYMITMKKKYPYKYVAEDMALSFSCLKEGIKTYVPPHPYYDVQMWGSKPEYGMQFGISEVALSFNNHNLNFMKEALKAMHEDGWKFLIESDKSYLDKIKNKFETLEVKNNVILEDIKKLRNENKKIYLYGAGKYGRACYIFLENLGIKIAGFVVTTKEHDYIYVNEKKINIYQIDKLYDKNIIIFLSMNHIFHKQINVNISEGMSVFPFCDCSYCYNDIYDLIL